MVYWWFNDGFMGFDDDLASIENGPVEIVDLPIESGDFP